MPKAYIEFHAVKHIEPQAYRQKNVDISLRESICAYALDIPLRGSICCPKDSEYPLKWEHVSNLSLWERLQPAGLTERAYGHQKAQQILQLCPLIAPQGLPPLGRLVLINCL